MNISNDLRIIHIRSQVHSLFKSWWINAICWSWCHVATMFHVVSVAIVTTVLANCQLQQILNVIIRTRLSKKGLKGWKWPISKKWTRFELLTLKWVSKWPKIRFGNFQTVVVNVDPASLWMPPSMDLLSATCTVNVGHFRRIGQFGSILVLNLLWVGRPGRGQFRQNSILLYQLVLVQ